MFWGDYQYASDEQLAEAARKADRNATVRTLCDSYSSMVSEGFIPIEIAAKKLAMEPADVVRAMVHFDHPVPAQYQYLLQQEATQA